MPLQAARTAEPILGYTVRERIGAGGYGEVWSADAPGGLSKAIKFVYGYLDDERAARELKALNRVKQVRHPFLLSLERIEVVDRQLVIVTELADSSLKDRFDECRRDGLPGIPREELLPYLHDAADALDYMREAFSLQHLDVKPENLLLVGGRVKVADFGLVKDIHDATASMMGGLTPVYAPPEAFNDHPSLYSDQYSLAIVYQELLTGVLPFPGKTAAQLAQQHMQSRPRLGPLPPEDRPIIERALAKKPEDRFGGCRELIDALVAGRAPDRSPADGSSDGGDGDPAGDTTSLSTSDTRPVEIPDVAPSEGPQRQACKTQPAQVDSSEPSSPSVRDTQLPPAAGRIAARRQELTDLPALDVENIACGPRPTLFVGLGGTAVHTLARLCHRIHGRWENEGEPPAVEMLLLDTDQRLLNTAIAADAEGPGHEEILALPIRRSEDYRADSEQLLMWMSRRWLYNIPRSLQTEGLRPLGRLAFVDHAAEVYERLRSKLTRLTSDESREALERAAGTPLRDRTPRIFVVASISGGAGGGMAIDVGYALRKLMSEFDVPESALCGVLIHSTDRKSAGHDLALANAYATLSELYAYARQLPYPGDSACELPASETGAPPFGQTYVVHLGDELSETEYTAAADRLADYLYLDACTKTGGLLDHCRGEGAVDGEGDPQELPVRSLGVYQIGAACDRFPALATNALCNHLLSRWCADGRSRSAAVDRGGAASEKEVQAAVEQYAGELDLNLDRLIEQLYTAVQKELDCDPETHLRDLAKRVLAQHQQGDCEPTAGRRSAAMIADVNQALGAHGPESETGASAKSIRAILDAHLEEFASVQGKAIRRWCLELLDRPDFRAGGAMRATDCFRRALKTLNAGANEMAQRFRTELGQTEQALLQSATADPPKSRMRLALGGGDARPDAECRLLQYARLRFHEAAFLAVRRVADRISGDVAVVADQVRDLRKDLSDIRSEFPDELADWTAAHTNGGAEPAELERRVALLVTQSFEGALPDLVAKLDERAQEDLVKPQGGLHLALGHGAEVRSALLNGFRRTARQVVGEQLRAFSVLDALPDGEQREETIRRSVRAASPKLVHCGGRRRVVVSAPDHPASQEFVQAVEAETGTPPTVVASDDGQVTICVELADVSLESIASSLVEDRPDCVEIANRVHTRIDVAWTPMAPTA